MLTPAQVEEILDRLAAYIAEPSPPYPVRCRVCLAPNQRELSRALLTHKRNDHAVGRELKIHHIKVRNHRVTCLVNRGGAKRSDVDWQAPYATQNKFPVLGSEVKQKQWLLKELTGLRDEALKKNPPDRKELFRLSKEIDAAADAYRKAKARANAKPAVEEPETEDLDLSPETKAAMSQVGKGESSGIQH